MVDHVVSQGLSFPLVDDSHKLLGGHHSMITSCHSRSPCVPKKLERADVFGALDVH
jgi:hypothetical protein